MAKGENKNKYDQEIVTWAKLQSAKMRRFVGGMTLKTKMAAYKLEWAKRKDSEYVPLERSIGAGIRRSYGEVTRINFRFRRQGIFLEHGAGYNRALYKPKPWINPVLNPAIDQLADIMNQQFADRAGDEIKIEIPGIISRRVKITNG